jgi:hypothetical protein
MTAGAGQEWLEAHSASREYFSLPRDYAKALGSLFWSDTFDGLALPGEKVISYDNLAEFLEGFASQRQLLSFGLMIHWTILLNLHSPERDFNRLHVTFKNTGGNWRNAGALAGMLSELLLPATNTPPISMLCVRLRDKAFPIRWFSGAMNGIANAGEEPPHGLVEFEQHVRKGLLLLSDDDLAMWLQFGRGPLGRAGENLAREQPPPRVAGNILDELLQRPRLAGAAAHVPQMVLALAVPPRRQAPEQLPIGGYSDIVTHGSVDRLLPSQHALDDIEFMRRFSENELLFFRREEPPYQCRQEVFVVLDQGVRAWGDVRLVLSAAALALAKSALGKALPCRLALTSRPEPFENPLEEENSQLGPALEACDFSRHPGLALERVLEWPSPVPRDIFLLTHPFSLLEEDVQGAARRLFPQDRLFALALDSRGHAELVQLRHGLPVRLKAFRVDFVRSSTLAAQAPSQQASWSGAVKPIGWPFRFGLDGPIRHFDFSYHGKRLLAVTESSMLYCWDLTNGEMEILPRPRTSKGLVKKWHDIVGVAGGFALLGSQDSNCLVAHYDWLTGKCVVHENSVPTSEPIGISYVRHCHAVILFHISLEVPLLAIDLDSGRSAPGKNFIQYQSEMTVGDLKELNKREQSKRQTTNQRAEQAMQHVLGVGPECNLLVPEPFPIKTDRLNKRKSYYCVTPTFGLMIVDRGRHCEHIFPTRDGVRTLATAAPQAVRRVKTTLAIYTVLPMRAKGLQRSAFEYPHVLGFYRGNDGIFLREINWSDPMNIPRPFRLANQGDKIALLRNDVQLEVQHTERPLRLLLTRQGGFGTRSRLWVGKDGLLLSCGRHGFAWHLLLWARDNIEVISENGRHSELSNHRFRHPRIGHFIKNSQPVEVKSIRHQALLEDFERWPNTVRFGPALFVLDRYGQVLVFDVDNKLVFQFFAHGDSWTAWLPDGTRHGLGEAHSWPNTPGALAAMGQALRQATGGAAQ